MAKKKFLVNIDLNLNQLINSRAENGTGFTTGGINSKGRLMYDTSTNRVLYDTGVAIESIANLNDVTGLLDFHGGYNALTNTPNLVNPPSGTTLKGDFYIVTVAGTFYGVALEIGDSLFASVDNPTTLSGWVIVQGNVAYATETIAGIILLATQTEVNTGTNNSKAVTPLTLSTYVANTRQNIYNTDGTLTADRTVTLADKSLVFNGSGTSFINYNINNGVQNAIQTFNANLVSHYIYNETLQLFSKANIENGIVSLKVFNVPLTINRSLVVNQFGTRINSIYYLPNVDGTAGQVMTTDGSGNLSWATSSSTVNIYNTDGTLTANRTVTINGRVLNFAGDINSTFRVSLIDPTTDTYSTIDNTINRILNQVGNNNDTAYNTVDITSNSITTTSVIGTQSSTITSTPTTITNRVQALGQSCQTTLTTSGFRINNAYTLPKVDGTAGQVLTTNGTGTVTWGTGSGGGNIYNTDGTLTANRTLTAVNFNLNFSGVGTNGVTSFSRSDGAGSQTNYDIRYDYFNLVSNTPTKDTSILITSDQIIYGISDTTTLLSTDFNQFTTAFRFFVKNNSNVINSLSIEANGININSAYTIPKVDGTAGQVLTTNGAGVVTWGAGGSGTSDIWKLNPNETYRGFSINNNSTTIVSDGGAVASTTATTSAQTVSGTSFVNKQVRLRYQATVVSAGRYTGVRGSALLWFIGGGFRYVCDFNISDTAYANQPQQFYGLANTIADLPYAGVSGIQINTLLNIIGVGNDTADANLQIFHNDGTGTATKIDLGASFPANRTAGAVSTTVYEIQLLNVPATTSIQYRVVNKETGAIATGTLTTNLPDANLGLNFFASRCMTTIGSITGSGQFDLCKLGVYSIL
jgi:hypothetical protein